MGSNTVNYYVVITLGTYVLHLTRVRVGISIRIMPSTIYMICDSLSRINIQEWASYHGRLRRPQLASLWSSYCLS